MLQMLLPDINSPDHPHRSSRSSSSNFIAISGLDKWSWWRGMPFHLMEECRGHASHYEGIHAFPGWLSYPLRNTVVVIQGASCGERPASVQATSLTGGLFRKRSVGHRRRCVVPWIHLAEDRSCSSPTGALTQGPARSRCKQSRTTL